jgi:hypothetical protein
LVGEGIPLNELTGASLLVVEGTQTNMKNASRIIGA